MHNFQAKLTDWNDRIRDTLLTDLIQMVGDKSAEWLLSSALVTLCCGGCKNDRRL